MSQANKKTRNTQNPESSHDSSVEVLYQRLGNKWFAFSLIGDEVFVGSIPVDAIAEDGTITMPSGNRTFKSEGNS